jgi:DNA-binding NtrC family response regulator
MTPRTGPLRILVVDDEPAIVRFLSASLESQGYLVSAAATRAPRSTRSAKAPLILSSSTSVCRTWMVSMSSSKSGIAEGPCRL